MHTFSELKVLIGTALWLHEHDWVIESVSLATGSGLESIDGQKDTIREVFGQARIPHEKHDFFQNSGPDITVSSTAGIWKFECKGLGYGERRTVKNNFDRAVASVVSYYDAPQTRLGLALAEGYLWGYDFVDKLPKALRKALSLWVFLVSKEGAQPIKPGEELPYPGALD